MNINCIDISRLFLDKMIKIKKLIKERIRKIIWINLYYSSVNKNKYLEIEIIDKYLNVAYFCFDDFKFYNLTHEFILDEEELKLFKDLKNEVFNKKNEELGIIDLSNMFPKFYDEQIREIKENSIILNFD